MPTMTLWGLRPAVVAPDYLKPARRAVWMNRCAAFMSRAFTARMKGSNLNTAGDGAGPAQHLHEWLTQGSMPFIPACPQFWQ